MTEMPKSPSFQRSGSDHEVITARQFTSNYLGGLQFSGLMSRWTTPLVCMYCTALASCERMFQTSEGDGTFCEVESQNRFRI